VTLPSGERVPALGQGTWHFGEDPQLRAEEATALRVGIDLGMTLIDTAETAAPSGWSPPPPETAVGKCSW
jgi:diketogulonate reductase-like aldo/keto reductase